MWWFAHWLAGPSFNQGIGGLIPALIEVSLSKTYSSRQSPEALYPLIYEKLIDMECAVWQIPANLQSTPPTNTPTKCEVDERSGSDRQTR